MHRRAAENSRRFISKAGGNNRMPGHIGRTRLLYNLPGNFDAQFAYGMAGLRRVPPARAGPASSGPAITMGTSGSSGWKAPAWWRSAGTTIPWRKPLWHLPRRHPRRSLPPSERGPKHDTPPGSTPQEPGGGLCYSGPFTGPDSPLFRILQDSRAKMQDSRGGFP